MKTSHRRDNYNGLDYGHDAVENDLIMNANIMYPNRCRSFLCVSIELERNVG